MTVNVGQLDRSLRFAIGLLLIILPFLTSYGLWQSTIMMWGSVLVGLILVGTAAMRFCPLYRVLGLKTCES